MDRSEGGYVAMLGLLFGVAIIGLLYWTMGPGAVAAPPGATGADGASSSSTATGLQAQIQYVHDAEGIKAAAESRDREYQDLLSN